MTSECGRFDDGGKVYASVDLRENGQVNGVSGVFYSNLLRRIVELPERKPWNAMSPEMLGFPGWESAMCWQCEVFDKELEHYRTLSARTTDGQTLKSLNILIDKLQAEKTKLHVVEFKRPAKRTLPR